MPLNALQLREKKIRNITLWGAFLNLMLMGLKLGVGLALKSSALVADGIHSLSDLATDFVVLAGAKLSHRPADKTHPYGHRKIETIASQFVAVVLLIVGFLFIWSAAQAIFRRQENFPGFFILVVASISVISKEVIFRRTKKVSRETGSAALYANAWHHRSDALSSIAVLIGGGVSLGGYGHADQAATIVVGVMIMAVGGKLFYEALMELTEGSADRESVAKIEKILSEAQDISNWHALRTRKLGGELFVDVHILVKPRLTVLESHKISSRLEKNIMEGLDRPVNILVHIEPAPEIN